MSLDRSKSSYSLHKMFHQVFLTKNISSASLIVSVGSEGGDDLIDHRRRGELG
jgi:hypothetical protein